MVVGVLRVELHIPQAFSLKDKRSAVKSLKDQLRGRFNVAVAEVEIDEKWQRAALGVAALGDERRHVEGALRHVVEWMRVNRFVELIRIDEEYL